MLRFVLVPLVLLSLGFLLPACATLTTGTAQSILVDVLNVQGVDCRGTDTRGRTYVWAKTPSSTMVHKGDGPLTLVCEKEGFKTTTMQFDEEVAGATFGNILIGGGIGLAVDIASGAAQEYPSQVHLVMEPVETASQSSKDDYEKWKKELKTQAEKESEPCSDGAEC